MITEITGNILESNAEAIVNPVNCVGVMGKGLALQSKRAYPENFFAYAAACRSEEVKLGSMFVFARNTIGNPKWIINFPTKDHWRNSSRLEYIRDGLADLRTIIANLGLTSIAVPALGTGNGGLNWNEVRSTIRKGLGELEHVEIKLYTPAD